MAHGSSSRSRRWVAAAASLALAVLGALTAQPAAADSAPVNPASPATPPTVTADALPTVQIDGVVWSQVVVGRTVYVAGKFDTARPAGAAPGVSTVTRKNLLAFDIETGALVTGFAPALNAQARGIAASPDGTRIYVVGDFTTVTEPGRTAQNRKHVAAFDTATGALVSTFRPSLSTVALAVTASNDTVYVGGNFTTAASSGSTTYQPRAHLAAFRADTGAVTPFVADANASVTALARTHDGAKIVAGGRFTQLRGAAVYGLGAVSPSDGTLLTFPANSTVRNAGPNASITSLYADSSGVYGTGYQFHGGGNLEGTFRANATTGALIWVADCHGDAYSTFAVGNEVYTASHHHYCGNMGGFLQTEPWSFYRGNAFSKAATGTNTADIYGYADFRGKPAPSMLSWFPDIAAGTYTGQNQGPWSVTGNARYVVYGGEFPTVNGNRQQGLVRFARTDIAPDKQGPRIGGTAFEPRAVSVEANTVRVSWRGNEDRDNDTLTYRVYREGVAAPIHTRTVTAPFWRNPAMSFTDTGALPGQDPAQVVPLPAGSVQRYRVTATDPFNNIADSTWVSVTVASSATARPYMADVLADGASSYWRLGTGAGSTLRDSAGFWDATAGAGVTHGVAGPLAGDPDAASFFDGTTTGFASTATPFVGPDTLTLEAWIRTTSASGGKIVGMGAAPTGLSKQHDRHLYMDNSGRLLFGANQGGAKTVASTGTYNDGAWHHVVGTLGSGGMRLYVDGAVVGQRTDITGGQLYSGYWRIGGDNVGTSWTTPPMSKYLAGAIDEVAVYPTALTGADVSSHYAHRSTATVANKPPTASFTASGSGLTASVDASGSTDPDGAITSYAWTFGDGASATGRTASRTYAAAGTYTVTLTVKDDAGATSTSTRTVTVTATAPGPAPLAADTFERAVTGGWGSASTGGSWSVSGGSANFTVAGGAGRQSVPAAGLTLTSSLNGVSSTSTDLQLTAVLDKPATGGGVYLSVLGRRVGTEDYRAKVKVAATGAVSIQALRGGTLLAGTTASATVSGLTYAAGERLQVRVQVTGTNPTTVRAKVWKAGTTEPTAWQVSGTDTTAALQTAGSIGLASYLSGSATNAPLVVLYDDVRAVPVG